MFYVKVIAILLDSSTREACEIIQNLQLVKTNIYQISIWSFRLNVIGSWPIILHRVENEAEGIQDSSIFVQHLRNIYERRTTSYLCEEFELNNEPENHQQLSIKLKTSIFHPLALATGCADHNEWPNRIQ